MLFSNCDLQAQGHESAYIKCIHKVHWSIDNSFECMSKIKNVNAHSVYTFDFSTLYTNLLRIDIHDKLTKLIKKMYQNANANYILVNTYTGKAFWSHTDKGSYKSFNLQHLLDALEFILNNTYQIWTTVVFANQRYPYGQ